MNELGFNVSINIGHLDSSKKSEKCGLSITTHFTRNRGPV